MKYGWQQWAQCLSTACAELVATQWTQNLSQKDTESAMEQQLTPGVIANKRSQILSLIQAKAASFSNAKERVC